MKLRTFAMIPMVLIGLTATVRSEDKPKATAPAKPAVAAPVAAASTGTNAVSAPSSAPSAKSDARSQYIVIGYLEKRDGTVITIKSGPAGPAYSVASKEGKVLFENLSSEQLRAKAPELHDFIKSAVADSKTKPIQDGSLRMQAYK